MPVAFETEIFIRATFDHGLLQATLEKAKSKFELRGQASKVGARRDLHAVDL